MAGASAWRCLHRGAVTIGDYRCACEGGGARGPAEASRAHSFALIRSGVFVKHVGGADVVADANSAVFFNAHEEYRVSHPGACGDRCTTFEMTRETLAEALGARGLPGADAVGGRGSAFEFHGAPVGREAFLAHRHLVEALRLGEVGASAAEESALAILDAALDAAVADRMGPGRKRRAGSDAADAERVNAVKRLLTTRLRERVSLAEAAEAAHCSAYHLSRIFRARAGAPMHQYQNRLRVRTAMEEALDPRADLTRIAAGLGFFDQSHFTGVFARETGMTPGAWRRRALGAGPAGARRMSKNFQALSRAGS